MAEQHSTTDLLATAPPEVAALGQPERVYQSRDKWLRSMTGSWNQLFADELLFTGWMFASGAIICLVLLALLFAKPSALALLVLAMVLGGVAFFVFGLREKKLPDRFAYLVFPAGLAYVEDGKWSPVIRWDEVPMFRTTPMAVVAPDGKEIALKGGVVDQKNMYTAIERRVVREVYRQSWATLEAGGSVSLGPFEIARDGLTHDGDFLPWDNLEAVYVSMLVPEGVQAVQREEVDSRIWIIARGTLTWCAEKWDAIPTRTVLPRLIRDLCPHVKANFTFDEESFRE